MAAMGVFLIFLGGKRQFAGSKVFTLSLIHISEPTRP